MNDSLRKSSIEEELLTKRRLVYSNVGDSMRPFIKQGRDLLVIERPAAWDTLTDDSLTYKLKKYDVPLYKRDNGKVYVLHRVLKVRDKDYVICGDNRRHKEYGINDRNVYGVLRGIFRDGKEYPLSGMKYRLYLAMWCGLFPLRAAIIFFRDGFKKLVKKK